MAGCSLTGSRKLAELSSMFSVEHIILERLTSLSLDMCHRQAIAHSPVLAASVHYPRPGLCDSVPSKPLTTTSKALSPWTYERSQPVLSPPLEFWGWGGGNPAGMKGYSCRRLSQQAGTRFTLQAHCEQRWSVSEQIQNPRTHATDMLPHPGLQPRFPTELS